MTDHDSPFALGKANILHEGIDVTVIGCGHVLVEAMSAARELAEKGIGVRVINMHTIKPLDEDSIRAAARETKHIFTIEDHQIIGGLGSAVAEVLASESSHPPLIKLGINDTFGQSGPAKELLQSFHLTATDLVQQILARKI